MREDGTCRNQHCRRQGPLLDDGCCSQACSQDAEEAAELAAGCRHLTVIHGGLDRAEDQQLLEQLLEATDTACRGRRSQLTSHYDRFTLTVGPPNADRLVIDLGELARNLADQATTSDSHDRWQVTLLKYPRERKW